MHRVRRLGLALVAAALISALLGCGDTVSEEPPGNSTHSSVGLDEPTAPVSNSPSMSPSKPSKVYLALGDSLTAGYQRATGDDKGGAYPALLSDELATVGVTVTVENLACSGESTTDMLSGGRCQPAPSSQLREAEAIAARHRGDLALVTLFIGANDVLRCISSGSVDRTCLAEGEEVYGENLPQILRRLRAVAGPDVPIAVLLYYDPFRQSIAGRSPPAGLRQSSAEGTERLNAALTGAAKEVDATVVDLRGLLEGADGSALCTMTSVCANGDFHFNARSNAAVADRLFDVLGPRLTS